MGHISNQSIIYMQSIITLARKPNRTGQMQVFLEGSKSQD